MEVIVKVPAIPVASMRKECMSTNGSCCMGRKGIAGPFTSCSGAIQEGGAIGIANDLGVKLGLCGKLSCGLLLKNSCVSAGGVSQSVTFSSG